jgi:two-component system nitrate/nitrite response regulator NarL
MPSKAVAAVSQARARVRILIADDHPTIRKMVRWTLEENARFEVCGEAFDGAKAIEAADRLKPDVVVMNVTMPVLNGIEAARIIRARVPESAIVILSTHADERLIEEAKRIGARAFVAKTRAGEALIKAIEAAIEGGDFVLMD